MRHHIDSPLIFHKKLSIAADVHMYPQREHALFLHGMYLHFQHKRNTNSSCVCRQFFCVYRVPPLLLQRIFICESREDTYYLVH